MVASAKEMPSDVFSAIYVQNAGPLRYFLPCPTHAQVRHVRMVTVLLWLRGIDPCFRYVRSPTGLFGGRKGRERKCVT